MPPKKTDISTSAETQDASDAEQTSTSTSTSTSEPIPDVPGRALIDLPAYGLKCGEYGALPAAIAASLAFSGEFDPRAVQL
jgi:hypothetical protein